MASPAPPRISRVVTLVALAESEGVYEPCQVTLLSAELVVESLEHRRSARRVAFDGLLSVELVTEHSPKQLTYSYALLLYVRTQIGRSQAAHRILLDAPSSAVDGFPHLLLEGWRSYLLAKSIATRVITGEDPQAIYRSTVASLKLPLHDESVPSLTAMFDRFAGEVLVNMRLKELCFQSRDVLVILQLLIKRVCALPIKSKAALEREKITNSVASSLRFETYVSPLDSIVLKRLQLVRALLMSMQHLLFSSEPIEHRHFTIAGSSGVLDLPSWLDVLTADAYLRTAAAVGMSTDSERTIISSDLDASMSMAFAGAQSSHRFASNLAWGINRSVVNSLNIATEDETSFASRVLSPLKVSSELHQFSFSLDKSSADGFLSVQRSPIERMRTCLFDLQTAVMHELIRLYGSSSRLHSNSIISASKEVSRRISMQSSQPFSRASAAALPNPSFGEYFVKQKDWDEMLLEIVSRVSELLDDFLASEAVVDALNKEPIVKTFLNRSVPNIPPSLRRGAERSASGAASLNTQEALLFHLTHLLLELCADSYKVRALVKEDAAGEVEAIMSVYNSVCPRPTQDADDDGDSTTSSGKRVSEPPKVDSGGDDDEPLAPHRYGAPRYGMSRSAWMLLVLSRCAVEEVVVLLDLNHVSFVSS